MPLRRSPFRARMARGKAATTSVPLMNNRAVSPSNPIGLVLALICMALALVLAKYSRQQASVQFPSSVASGVDENK